MLYTYRFNFIVYKTVSKTYAIQYSKLYKFAWSVMHNEVSIRFHGGINREYYSYIKVSNGKILSSEKRKL